MDISDHELLRRYRRGDRSAFELMVRRWDERVMDLAYRITGDPEEARDIRQIAFLRLLRSLDRFNGTARFSTWFYRVVLNLSLDRRRSRLARDRHEGGDAPGEEPAAAAPSPAQCSERDEVARLVADAVAALRPTERVVVVLRHYHSLPFSEIGGILGLPTSTVKSRMQRALTALRERLKNVGM
jgi:RNA polymerase sigma-70 factor (ECF subfamily)